MIHLFRGWSKERGQDASRDYKKHTYCGEHLPANVVTLHPPPIGDDEIVWDKTCKECEKGYVLHLLGSLP